MEEYLKTLLLQIRCKKARPFIEEEIRAHIEDQMEDNIHFGMSKEEAERAAVLDMGDPVAVGVSMDRIHKPQIAWKLLALISVISVLGIILHKIICFRLARFDGEIISRIDVGSTRYVYGVLVGLAVMVLIYFIDYTVIAQYARLIAVIMILLTVISGAVTNRINGVAYYVGVGPLRITSFVLLSFYVPIYGAVLYKYYKTGYVGFLKSLLWMIVPVYVAFTLPNVMLAAIMFLSMLVLLTVAIGKDWFLINKKIVIPGIWVIGILGPMIGLAGMVAMNRLATYQIARINAFLSNSGDANYVTTLLRNFMASSKLVGNCGKEVIGAIPNYSSDYIFVTLSANYGMLAGILVVCILAAMIVMIFQIATHQNNQLGMLMGYGCGMIFALNTAINIFENLGLLPVSSTFLPFFSAGKNNLILSYALIGLMLSIYRYKNVYPRHVQKRSNVKTGDRIML
ncbi:MAG: FtsW/RodA/SpoVE family cell cycle protein [Lachnospiraceae bacterium]